MYNYICSVRVLIILAFALVGGGLAAHGGIVYNNTSTSLSTLISSTNEIGDDITLGGNAAERLVTEFKVRYYMTANSSVTGNEKVRLKIYDSTGPNNAPGNLLYESGLISVLTGYNYITVNPNIQVPDSLVWVAQFTNLTANVKPGLILYNPPSVGSSSTNYWEKLNGTWTFLTVSGKPGNFYAQLTATNAVPTIPPSITTPPQPIVAMAGSNATFTVVATGSAPLRYQWRLNGGDIANATNTSLPLSGVTASQAGDYVVVVTNALGSVTSTPPAHLTVVTGRPVYDNLQNYLGSAVTTTNEFGDQVTLGGNALDRQVTQFKFEYLLGTNGNGNEKVAIRFYENTGTNNSPGRMFYDSGLQSVTPGQFKLFTVFPNVIVPDAFTWAVQFTNLSTGQTASLTLYDPPVLGSSTDNYWEKYEGVWNLRNVDSKKCNFGAQIIADAATNRTPPVIVTQPVSQTVLIGDRVTLAVTATGSPPMTYQWKLNGSNVTGATYETLIYTNTSPDKAGSYTVTITNPAGSTNSQPAVLTVLVPVGIQTQPSEKTEVVSGTNVTFSVVPSGSPPFIYQWSKGGAAIPWGTTADLVLTNVTTSDAGYYSVAITNAAGVALSPSYQLVVSLGWIEYQNLDPNDYLNSSYSSTNEFGDQITLSGTSQIRKITQFQVEYRLGTNVTGNEKMIIRFRENTGLSNAPGRVFYESAPLSLYPSPTYPFNYCTTYPNAVAPDTFTWTVQFVNVTTNQHAALNFYSQPDVGNSDTNFWERVGGIWNHQMINGLTNAHFGCVVMAHIKPADTLPGIVTPPQSLIITNGDAAEFTVSASGSPPLNYQWKFNGTALPGAIYESLSLAGATTNQAGSYTVVITNTAGSITSSPALLTVWVPPSIQTQPKAYSVVTEDAVSLSVAASGTTPLLYQWTKDGTAVAGATNATLSISSVQTNDAGSYRVIVSNVAGTVTSGAAQLKVAVGRLVYDNMENFSMSIFPVPSTNEFGDQVTLGGNALDRKITQFQFEYVLGTNHSTGTERAQLRFYENSGTNNYPGRLLYQSLPMTMQPGSYNLVTAYPNVEVPDTFTWTLQFNGIATNQDASLSLFYPPTVGSVATNFWEKYLGEWFPLRVSADRDNFGVKILAHVKKTNEPPVIVVPPETPPVIVGHSTVLSAEANGSQPLRYQWFFNGNRIDSATNAMLSLNSVTTNQAGIYTILITNGAGSITSAPVTLTVWVPPAIVTPVHDLAVVSGTNVTLSVLATGTTPLSYQWAKNGVDLTGETNATLVFGKITPADQGSYRVSITNVAGATNSSAKLSVALGWVVYDNFATVGDKGYATVNEFGDQITLGGDSLARKVTQFEFEYYLDGILTGNEKVKLRFYDNTGTNNSSPEKILYESDLMPVTAGFHMVTNYPNIEAPDTFTWTVQFFGVTPNKATNYLTFYDPPVVGSSSSKFWERLDTGWIFRTAPAVRNANFGARVLAHLKSVDEPPEIVTQPKSQTVTNGVNVLLSVDATGSIPMSYQWYFNGGNMPGATRSSLPLNNVTTNQDGSYSVVITNLAGSITSQVARLVVLYPPGVVTQPKSGNYEIDSTATLSVEVIGAMPMSFQWSKDGVVLPGADQPMLTLSKITTNAAGVYTVFIRNSAGTITSDAARVSVWPYAQLKTVYDNTTTTLGVKYISTNEFGDEVMLAGTPLERVVREFIFKYYLGTNTSGNETIRLKLYDNTGPNQTPKNLLYDSGTLSIHPGLSNFITNNPNQEVPGDFTWTVQFAGLTASTNAGLLIYDPPTVGSSSNTFWEKSGGSWGLMQSPGANVNFAARITAGPVPSLPVIVRQPQNQTVALDSQAAFDIEVRNAYPMGYQWFFNSQKLTGETNFSLTLNQALMNQAGSYQIVITNVAGAVTSAPAVLIVQIVSPVVTTQPQSLIAAVGSNATFTVTATGSQPLTYQWQLNGTNLNGATKNSLLVTNVQAAKVGNYTVVVSNSGGSISSQPATLSLPNYPLITTHPLVQSVSAGALVNLRVEATNGSSLRYQWSLNGQPLSGETNATLVLTKVTASQAGIYTVEVKNSVGTLPSWPVALTLVGIEMLSDQTAGLTIAGPLNTNYRIENRSSFETGSNWTSQGVIKLTNSPSVYRDPNSFGQPSGYYRVIWAP